VAKNDEGKVQEGVVGGGGSGWVWEGRFGGKVRGRRLLVGKKGVLEEGGEGRQIIHRVWNWRPTERHYRFLENRSRGVRRAVLEKRCFRGDDETRGVVGVGFVVGGWVFVWGGGGGGVVGIEELAVLFLR